jgi:NTE family protein
MTTTSGVKTSTATDPGPTAFVLAGGGSFGAVQVGMLRELVGHGLVPDMVVGSSAGAINGAYFAGEPNAQGVEKLAAIWRDLDRHEVFPLTLMSIAGFVMRRSAMIDPSGLRGLLQRHLPYDDLGKAALPVHVIATDLVHGGTVRLSKGPAVDAVLASCAIPAAFPSVYIDGKHLVDGAVANNTPIAVAVELGAKRIIVLPTGYACALSSPPSGAIACALQAITLLTAHQLVTQIEQFRDRVEIVTVPPLCPLSVSPYDFSQGKELIERAADQTRRWLQKDGLSRQHIPGALRPHVD